MGSDTEVNEENVNWCSNAKTERLRMVKLKLNWIELMFVKVFNDCTFVQCGFDD